METAPLTAKLTRRELYDRVWSTPVIRVAAELGITNFVLTNLCKQHRIPSPTSGHWSKIAHGKPVTQPALEGDVDAIVDIARARTPGYRAANPRRLKTSSTQPIATASPVVTASPPAVPTELHVAVKKTVDRIRAAAGKGRTRIAGPGCFTVVATDVVADRVAIVLHRLTTEVEAAGWHVRKTDKRLEFDVDGEAIGFELNELTDRVKHQPTDQELSAKAKLKARLASAARTGAYVSTWDAPKIPDWDHVPNGKLSLVLDETVRYLGVRRTFTDRKTQRVETLIDCVIEALAGYALAQKERRAEHARAKVRAEEQQREREALRRQQQIEARRVEFAERQIARLERIDRFSALLGRLGDEVLPGDTDLFRDWLRTYIAKLEDDLAGEQLAERLASTRLMHGDAKVDSWIDVETGGYRSSV